MKINYKKRGFVNIYVILMIAGLAGLMLFIALDLPYYMTMNKRIKSSLDNATSAGTTMLVDSSLPSGNLIIDESACKNKINKMIQDIFYLDSNFNPLENSPLAEKPEINITVVNQPNTGTNVTTKYRTYIVNNTCVIVEFKCKTKSLFINSMGPQLFKTSISQVQFH